GEGGGVDPGGVPGHLLREGDEVELRGAEVVAEGGAAEADADHDVRAGGGVGGEVRGGAAVGVGLAGDGGPALGGVGRGAEDGDGGEDRGQRAGLEEAREQGAEEGG